MAGQVKFYERNIIDLTNDNVTISVADSVATNTGESFADYMRNRKNSSAWITTDSSDAGTTTLIIDMTESRSMEKIIIIGHNFKAYTIKYWNGSAYVDFSTAISEATYANTNSFHDFTSVSADKIQIIITGTQVADEDKYIKQLIFTEELGQFDAFPEIRNPTHDTGKRVTKMLSGKRNIVAAVGAFSCELSVEALSTAADLALVEQLFERKIGFLVLLSGELESQFKNVLTGYRNEDIYLMKCSNNYEPEFYKYCYQNGTKINMKLNEVIS